MSGLIRFIKGVYDPETTAVLVDEPVTDLSRQHLPSAVSKLKPTAFDFFSARALQPETEVYFLVVFTLKIEPFNLTPSETVRLASIGKAAKISAKKLRCRNDFIVTPIFNYLYATQMPKKFTVLTFKIVAMLNVCMKKNSRQKNHTSLHFCTAQDLNTVAKQI